MASILSNSLVASVTNFAYKHVANCKVVSSNPTTQSGTLEIHSCMFQSEVIYLRYSHFAEAQLPPSCMYMK